eukprot:m.117530 g.117530  ORF g.117530 m.117530 type:complete len:832 (+) comp28584_c7_seq1:97-2592(+)
MEMNGSDDDVAVTAEDEAFFLGALRGDSSASFLDNMTLPDPKQWVNPRKAKRKRAMELAKQNEEETDFEKQPRVRSDVRKEQQEEEEIAPAGRLPIKVGKKLILAPKRKLPEIKSTQPKPNTTAPAAPTTEARTETKAEAVVVEAPMDRVMRIALREKLLMVKKMEIATLSSDILANVEESATSLRKLRELCSCKEEGIAITVQKLAIMSLATVFKDIVPGYRIREMSSKEKDVVVSKDVKALREHEQMMLRNYQMYLQRIHAIIKESDQPRESLAEAKEATKMRVVCIKALCLLLLEIPHFNYRSNIIELVVPRMTDMKNDKIASHCCDTVQKLFREDQAFDATQETVKAMSRVIKASNYRVKDRMIKCFFFLKLNGSIIKDYLKNKHKTETVDKNGNKKHKSRMDKKELKAEKELGKELKEAQVTVDNKALARRQTEILNQIFATYFRVLKHGRHSPILPIVLEGISKQAHLIDASFFGDLMAVLREIMKEGLGTSISLQTVRTGCMLLSGQAGLAMNIDVKAFHDVLYAELLNATDERGVDLAMICTRLLLNERREVSLERVGAFTKRLALVAIQLQRHNQTVTALSNIRTMMQRYPKLETLLDSDSMSTAIYRPEVPEPEHSNPLATPLWELVVLNKHYYPWVKTYAKHLAFGAPSSGTNSLPPKLGRAVPHALSKALDSRQHGFCFNPPMQKPKIHPLRKNLPDSGFRHSSHIQDVALKIELPKKYSYLNATNEEQEKELAESMDERGYKAIVRNAELRRQVRINDRHEAKLDALRQIMQKFASNRAKMAEKKAKTTKIAKNGKANAGKTKTGKSKAGKAKAVKKL